MENSVAEQRGVQQQGSGEVRPTATSKRKGRRSPLVMALLLLGSMVMVIASPTPAGAEISPNPSSTWGVTGIGPTQFTGPIANQVFAIEQIGDRIFVGGKFTEVRQFQNSAPIAQPYLAAFDLETGAYISSFTPAVDAPVYALQASPDGSRLFVGGEFTNVNGASATEGLAAIDPLTGSVDPTWITDLNNPYTTYPVVVKSLDLDASHLYIGGTFSAANGRDGLPRITLGRAAKASLVDGLVDSSWTPTVSGGSVWGIAVAPDGNSVHLGGYFSSVNGQPETQYFTTVDNTTGELVPGLTSYISQIAYTNRGYLQDVVAYGDKVWLGGSEHVIYQLDATDNTILRQHSTRRGGDYQDLEIVGDRLYGSCHCYTDHYADYDYWVNRGVPVPADVLVTPIKYVAAYGADSGDYIPEFQLNASATQSGVWAIHGDSNGCLWVGGDLSVAGSPELGTDEWAGGFARYCESAGGALPAPTGFTSTFQDKSRVVLRWNMVAGAATYEILRDGVVVGTDNDGWFTDLGLAEGTTYSYEIRALTAGGDLGDLSPAISVTTTGTPQGQPLPAPTNVVSTFQDRGRAVLHWDVVSGAASYEILRDGVVVGTDNDTWYTDLGLTPGTTYSYQVRAIDGAGDPGDLSAPIAVSTQP